MAKAIRSIAKHKRHKKWLKRAKGHEGRHKSVFKLAKEAVLKAGQHAYRDRRKKKAEFRSLWQIRINAAAREQGLSYSKFIQALRAHKIGLDRKVMAELAVKHPAIFQQLVEKVK